jgi:hypothetical protein
LGGSEDEKKSHKVSRWGEGKMKRRQMNLSAVGVKFIFLISSPHDDNKK